MKKILFVLAAVAALTACSKNEIEYEQTSEISFAPVAKNITKSMITGTPDGDKQVAFPISSIVDMEKNGLKSINVKTYQNYSCMDIPGQKKRVFIDSDYKCLLEYFKEVND